MTDGDLWKVQRAFAVRHLKLLGLGQHRMDQMIRDEYRLIVDGLQRADDERRTDLCGGDGGGGGVALAPDLQTAVMNVVWGLTAGSTFDDPELLALMSRRSAAFDMAGGLLNQIPWIRYVAPAATGYELIRHINRQLYASISVSAPFPPHFLRFRRTRRRRRRQGRTKGGRG